VLAVSVVLLVRELGSLHARIRDWSPIRFAASALASDALMQALTPVAGPAPAPATRGDAVYLLVVGLARWGRVAGVPVPAGVDPPRLGDHSLADQLAVTGADLLAAAEVEAVALAALRAVAAARTGVDGSSPPADVGAALDAAVPPDPGAVGGAR
jgi:hypothetical protein